VANATPSFGESKIFKKYSLIYATETGDDMHHPLQVSVAEFKLESGHNAEHCDQ